MAIRIKSSGNKITRNSGKKKTTVHPRWKLVSDEATYIWGNQMERVNIVREGIGYSAIETISARLNSPVKAVLSLMRIPQTTYNKKRSEKHMMDVHSSEWILLVSELIDFGHEVFNHEEDKWLRWLQKPNISLGGQSPLSMLDTTTGIAEVRSCLNRIEFGNLA